MKKLAIVVTHPIQYYAPVFKMLSKHLSVKVFYTAGLAEGTFDAGFQRNISWDLPLLEGYDYEFLINSAKDPGSHHFRGVIANNATERITDFNPDNILIYGWAYVGHLKIMRYFRDKIPIIFRGDSTLLDESAFWKSALKFMLLRWVYSHVDHAVFVGSLNKLYYKKYGLKNSQLSFAPHAIDNERFAFDRRVDAAQLRESLQIPTEAILILFAGKLEPKKNPIALLNSYLTLKNRNVHLLFVGNGVLENLLKSKASASKSKTIHFLPFQNQQQMPVIYQACDLFCLPSKGPGETWGLSVNEAMAAGKAILVSNKAGAAIDLVNHENGSIFDSGDLNDLTIKLNQLIISKEHLIKLGKSSALRIAQWNFEKQVNGILKYV